MEDRRLEADARAERRFLEQQSDDATGQQRFAQPSGMLRLEILRDRKDPFDFLRSQIENRQYVSQ